MPFISNKQNISNDVFSTKETVKQSNNEETEASVFACNTMNSVCSNNSNKQENSLTIKNDTEKSAHISDLADILQNNPINDLLISNKETFEPFDFDINEVIKYSAAHPISIIPGTIIDLFDKDTKDGEIGETEQVGTGDCWILSGINALSYTEEGRNTIKNALEYHDGYTIVHLATGDYVVSDKEITETKGSSQYSSGDDDMIIFELAIEKVLDEFASGKLDLKEGAPWYIANDAKGVNKTSVGKSSTNGGWQAELWYLVTGKASEGCISKKKDVTAALDKFQENGSKDFALACVTSSFEDIEVEGLSKNFFGKYFIEDVNGEKHKIGENHAYAVKSVTDDTVTVTNPWDSGDEIVLTRKQYLELFDYTQSIDLSSNNHEKDYITYVYQDDNGEVQSSKNRRVEYDEKGNFKYAAYERVDKNGYKITAYDLNNDGRIDKYTFGTHSFAAIAKEMFDKNN